MITGVGTLSKSVYITTKDGRDIIVGEIVKIICVKDINESGKKVKYADKDDMANTKH